MDPILVAGGGVGGLGAALAVARAGFPVRFFERSAECREIGVCIRLGPNVFHMRDRLGVASGDRHGCGAAGWPGHALRDPWS
jgi:3-hydroxybenzoate 6-monooxygenase